MQCPTVPSTPRTTETDIVARLSIRMFLSADKQARQDTYRRSGLILDILQASREFCIQWLASNDRNGCYTDDDMEAEGWEPMTLNNARALLIATVLED